jgi:hypothetical protein
MAQQSRLEPVHNRTVSVPFPGFDAGKPSIARVYDYWLGGKDNYASDQAVAEGIAQLWPGVVGLCRHNRTFVVNAVNWVARQGITQFLDLGAGLPTHPSVHEAARGVNPDARVCYVDNDPVAVLHAQALLAKPEGISAVRADMTDPATVWDDPQVRTVINPNEPVCVIVASVLQFIDIKTARAMTAGYVSELAVGSAAVISAPHSDDEEYSEKLRHVYTAGASYNHSREEIESLFAGLDLVPPGLVLAHAWRGGMTQVPQRPEDVTYMLGGVGLKQA